MNDSQAAASAASSGGIVEPTNRAALAKELPQARPPAARYELHDPFAEVTYRLDKYDAMVTQADRLHAMRFTAIDAEGKRSFVEKGKDGWPPTREAQRDTPRQQAAPERNEPKLAPAKVVQTNPDATPERVAAKHVDTTPARTAHVTNLEAALNERYVIKRAMLKVGDLSVGQTEYRYRGATGRLAFTESTLRLSTDHNNPSVARSMVDVAEARDWKALRIAGHDDFKRMVWLEASLRGVKTVGYEPVPGDLDLLRKEREARHVNRVEPDRTSEGSSTPPAAAGKASARGSGGRKAVLAALEAVLVSKQVPERQREAVMAAAAENLSKRVAAGQTHKVKVYDKAATPQRPAVRAVPEPQRTRDRAAPAR